MYLIPSYNSGSITNIELENLFKNYLLTIISADGTLDCNVKYKTKNFGLKKSLNFVFKIFLPKYVNIDVNTGSGNISLSNLNGYLNFNTAGGALLLNQVSGNVKGHTSGGVVIVEACTNKLNINTTRGNISVKNSEGDFNIKTLNGNISL